MDHELSCLHNLVRKGDVVLSTIDFDASNLEIGDIGQVTGHQRKWFECENHYEKGTF